MTNYQELTNQLKEQDEHIITKLSIYHELAAYTSIAELPTEEVNEIVEFLHDIYFSNSDMDYLYPKVAEAALDACDYDAQQLLTSIRENAEELEDKIFEGLY